MMRVITKTEKQKYMKKKRKKDILKAWRRKKMARKKTTIKYDTIKIPEGLTLKIDVMQKASMGDYTSKTDVIKDAVRLLWGKKGFEKGEIENVKSEQSATRGDGLAESKDGSEGANKTGQDDALDWLRNS